MSAEEFERERAEAVELAHKAMASSYIGKPPPGLRGDADRMVAALLKAGWTPPGKTIVEHATGLGGSSIQVRNPNRYKGLTAERWVQIEQRYDQVWKRRIIVVEDWTAVPRERG